MSCSYEKVTVSIFSFINVTGVKLLICTSFSDEKVMDCVNNELKSNFMGLFCTKK